MTQKITGVYSPKIETVSMNRFGIKTINTFLVISIIACSLYYVTGINDLVVKGFTIQSLKSKVSLLREQNRDLSIETTSLKSYNNLAKRIGNLNMVAVDNIDYIKVDSGVALVR